MEQEPSMTNAPSAPVTEQDVESADRLLSMLGLLQDETGGQVIDDARMLLSRLATEVRRLTAAWAEDSRQMQALYEETHAAADAAIRERDEARAALAAVRDALNSAVEHTPDAHWRAEAAGVEVAVGMILRVPGLEQANREAHQAVARLKKERDEARADHAAAVEALAAASAHASKREVDAVTAERERDEARSTLAHATAMIAADWRDFDAIRAAIPGYNQRGKPPVLADAVRALVKERDEARPAARKEAAEMMAQWLRDRADAIEAEIDDECDGEDADRFCAEAKVLRDAARDLATWIGSAAAVD